MKNIIYFNKILKIKKKKKNFIVREKMTDLVQMDEEETA